MRTKRETTEAHAGVEATLAAIDGGELEADDEQRASLQGAARALREVLEQ